MLTGTLTFTVEVEAANEAALQSLSTSIEKTVNAIPGVSNCEEVDSDIDEVDEG